MTDIFLRPPLLYTKAGAREKFEELCALLIQSEFSEAKSIRVQRGDGGVDTFVGNWDESGRLHVFQVKYFPDGVEDPQKQQIRESFDRCLSNPHFTTVHWTLCLPIDFSEKEATWFANWRKGALETLSDEHIDYWGATTLSGILHKSYNAGIKEAFFHEDHYRKIREIHERVRTGGLSKDTVKFHLTSYFRQHQAAAQQIVALLENSNVPQYRFNTSEWAAMLPQTLATFQQLYPLMANTVQELEHANRLLYEIEDLYKNPRYPLTDGLNLNAPSPYLIPAINKLKLFLLQHLLPKLETVLTMLEAQENKIQQ